MAKKKGPRLEKGEALPIKKWFLRGSYAVEPCRSAFLNPNNVYVYNENPNDPRVDVAKARQVMTIGLFEGLYGYRMKPGQFVEMVTTSTWLYDFAGE